MSKRWGLILLILALGIWGCSDEDPVGTIAPTPFELLAQQGADYINGSAPGVLAAADVLASLDTYTVLDFRSTEVYGTSHIPGAIDASKSTLVANVASYDEGKPFLCVCYSGHSAGQAVFALRMLGYEAYSLGWGMASWTQATMASWTGKWDNLATPVQTAAPELTTTYDFPVLDDYTIEARLEEVLLGTVYGSNFIGYTDMLASAGGLDDYFIVNYFTEAQYLGEAGSGSPGHLEGAYQFTPKASLGQDQLLEYLPTDMPIVIYCWTGQHGSQVSSYLRMLGYEAYDLSGGSNVLWHDLLTGHQWNDHANDYVVEP